MILKKEDYKKERWTEVLKIIIEETKKADFIYTEFPPEEFVHWVIKQEKYDWRGSLSIFSDEEPNAWRLSIKEK